ncbi:MAG: lysophospholipid acyltransferase family protein [Alphaproteobacteria bacterium]
MAERLDKRILKSNAARASAAFVIALYIRFVHLTSRFEVVGDSLATDMWESEQPFILSFWHNRLLMMPYCWRRGVPIGMLISQHRDGELIARAIGHFGLGTIRGSSAKPGKDQAPVKAKGGMAAVRTMVKAVKAGQSIGFTPDGPRGPAMRASDGVVAVARMTGVPILPVTYAVSRRRVLNSWDSFVLALPFSRGVIIWGTPIEVPRNADAAMLEEKRQELEDQMNALAARADTQMGCTPLGPSALGPAA